MLYLFIELVKFYRFVGFNCSPVWICLSPTTNGAVQLASCAYILLLFGERCASYKSSHYSAALAMLFALFIFIRQPQPFPISVLLPPAFLTLSNSPSLLLIFFRFFRSWLHTLKISLHVWILICEKRAALVLHLLWQQYTQTMARIFFMYSQ